MSLHNMSMRNVAQFRGALDCFPKPIPKCVAFPLGNPAITVTEALSRRTDPMTRRFKVTIRSITIITLASPERRESLHRDSFPRFSSAYLSHRMMCW